MRLIVDVVESASRPDERLADHAVAVEVDARGHGGGLCGVVAGAAAYLLVRPAVDLAVAAASVPAECDSCAQAENADDRQERDPPSHPSHPILSFPRRAAICGGGIDGPMLGLRPR